VREMLDVEGLVRHFLSSASFMVCHGRFLRGRHLRVRPLLYTRGLAEAWFVRLGIIKCSASIDYIIDGWCCPFHQYLHYFSNSFLFYVAVHVCTNSIINN